MNTKQLMGHYLRDTLRIEEKGTRWTSANPSQGMDILAVYTACSAILSLVSGCAVFHLVCRKLQMLVSGGTVPAVGAQR